MESKIQTIRVNWSTLKTDITEEEKKFRETRFADESCILKKKVLNCTACGKSIKEEVLNKDIHVHPVLDVLWCKSCEEFYGDGVLSADEGGEKYCRWCAEGGKLLCCSYCPTAFCKKCVTRNFSFKMLKDIENDDGWRCFVCVVNPLWSLRALCDAAKRYVDSNFSPESPKCTQPVQKNSAHSIPKELPQRSRQKRKIFSRNTRSVRKSRHEENKMSTKRKKRSEVDSNEVRGRKQTKLDGNEEEFKSIVKDAITESITLRELWRKLAETSRKKYLSRKDDVIELAEIVNQFEEEFTSSMYDIKTRSNRLVKSFVEKIKNLKNELNQTPESNEKSSLPESPEMISTSSSNLSLTISLDDSIFNANEEQPEPGTSPKSTSVNDSLIVNVFSTINSLNSDEENELLNMEVIEQTIDEDIEEYDGDNEEQ